MKSVIANGLIIAALTGGTCLVLTPSVQGQNVIRLNSTFIQQCKNPTTFDGEYQVEGLCNFLHVKTFIRGQFNQVVVNNESLWTMLTTPSGQPIGICYLPGAKVNHNFYTFQCPFAENNQNSGWQNSGNSGYYGNQPTQRSVPRVCARQYSNTQLSGAVTIFNQRWDISNQSGSSADGCNY
jgi:hypothetical protein